MELGSAEGWGVEGAWLDPSVGEALLVVAVGVALPAEGSSVDGASVEDEVPRGEGGTVGAGVGVGT